MNSLRVSNSEYSVTMGAGSLLATASEGTLSTNCLLGVGTIFRGVIVTADLGIRVLSKFQEGPPDEIIEIEQAEVGFSAFDTSGVGRHIADFADVVSSAHQTVVFKEFHERCAGHQLVQRCPCSDFGILERVDGLDQPFESPAAMQGTGIVI